MSSIRSVVVAALCSVTELTFGIPDVHRKDGDCVPWRYEVVKNEESARSEWAQLQPSQGQASIVQPAAQLGLFSALNPI